MKYKLKFEIGNVTKDIFFAEDSNQIDITISRTLQTIWGIDDEQIKFVVGSIAYANVLELAKKNELHLIRPIVLNTFTSGKEPPSDLYPITEGSIFSFPQNSKPEDSISNISETSILIDDISEIRDNINTYTKSLLGRKILLINQERALFDMYKTAKSDTEFIYRISSLTGLIISIDKKTIKAKLEKPSKDTTGELLLLEELLALYSDKDIAEDICTVFKKINDLRKGYPVHGDYIDTVLPAHNFFNLSYPIENYEMAWEIILDRYFNAMRGIMDILKRHYNNNDKKV